MHVLVGACRAEETLASVFHVCPRSWRGDGECDAVCNTTRYFFDCGKHHPCRHPLLFWSPEKGRLGASALSAGGGPADNSKTPPVCDCGSDWHGSLLPLSPFRSACSASTNFAHLEQHCREIGGRCLGKGQECTGTTQLSSG